ncbi:hypothetical protein AB4648_08325 [Vibrio splendidus]
MNNNDKKYIKDVSDSVLDLHIQKIPTKGDSLIHGKLDLKELRSRVTEGFSNNVCDELQKRGFSAEYDHKSKTVDFQTVGVDSVSLSLEQRKEAASQLKIYNTYNPKAATDILEG